MKVRRLTQGEVFASHYLVGGLLGQGSMGTVYRAVDQRVGEPRALKVMSGDLVAAPDFSSRFVLEASIGDRIADGHVVRVFETGVDRATGLPFYAMELLEGEDLARLLEREGDLAPELGHALLRQLFGAVAAAHDAKVVHRDLKPENLFVARTEGGPVLKILDFGVAKVVRETTMGGTKPGLGTPLWTAPEQGREGQVIRPAADVWALGLLAYRLLAGKMYWRAASVEKASAFDLALEMLRAPIEPASVRSAEIGARSLGPSFDAWFARCVDRDPTRRFVDARQAYAALEPLLGAAPNTPAPTRDEAFRSPLGRARGRAIAAALAVMLVLVLIVVAVRARGGP